MFTELFCTISETEGIKIVDKDGNPIEQRKFRVSEDVNFAAEGGFELLGKSQVQCQIDGLWDVGDGDRESPLPKTTDVDECLIIEPCHPMAECVNTYGSYSCTCNEGYIGNGKICISKFS